MILIRVWGYILLFLNQAHRGDEVGNYLGIYSTLLVLEKTRNMKWQLGLNRGP